MTAGSERQGEPQTEREDARRQRLAQALRDNLKRRKAQIRGRAGAEPARDTQDRTEN